MNYLGSKIRLSKFIYNTVSEVVDTKLSELIFCDLFAGTGTIGKLFQRKVKNIISNDREYYSYVLNRAYFKGNNNIETDLINQLNEVNGNRGFIFNEYSENGKAGRLYFSEINGQKIDAIRLKIEEWRKAETICEEQYYYLLASLLTSVDKIANTATMYGAYLKQLKTSAKRILSLHPISILGNHQQKNEVFNQDSNKLIKKISGDILYLDPPYNRREYAANYHLLNTIALYDCTFIPQGKTGIRPYKTSKYCLKNKAAEALDHLVGNADFEYIFLSYNNEGLYRKKV